MITTLEEAEDIIASGKADIVAMAKSFMADGDIIHKSLAGESAEVRPCTRCDLCGNANTYGTAMSCAINPRCGIAGEIEQLPEAERKNVMVIGGGPAGMMAAQTLVKRGHTVTLYEKADKLGGLLIDASMVPFKQLMREYLDWDIKETLNCGAKIVLNTAVTESLIEQEDPDAIIVATGSVYVNPPIPGMDSALAVRDVDSHAVEPGKNVVVCGGGITGLECALLALAQEGKTVTVVDMLPRENFVMEMPIFNKADLLAQLEEKGVQLIGSQKIQSIDGGVHGGRRQRRGTLLRSRQRCQCAGRQAGQCAGYGPAGQVRQPSGRDGRRLHRPGRQLLPRQPRGLQRRHADLTPFPFK